MEMNQDKNWLVIKAIKEDGCQVSTGGLVGDLSKGMAGRVEETSPSHKLGNYDLYVDHSIPPVQENCYSLCWWVYPRYYNYQRTITTPNTQTPNLHKIMEKTAELSAKLAQEEKEKIAKQKVCIESVDNEVYRLQGKLKDIQSQIETKRKKKERDMKIKELNEQIAKAENELTAL